MTCERCHSETTSNICSVFNTEQICPSCKRTETRHPDYEAARVREEQEVLRGNYNFPGVGKPSDL